jgi:surface polysaccharide O-acyltransferase-like enzyme
MMSEKRAQADHLRAVATLAVIVVHVSDAVVAQYGKISNEIWQIGNTANSLSRFCVPVFLMLTGALVLAKDYPLGVFFKRRMSRVVLPFLFWSLVYIVYEIIASSIPMQDIAYFTFDKLKNGASYHLWYI